MALTKEDIAGRDLILVSLGSGSCHTQWVVVWDNPLPHGGGQEGQVVGAHQPSNLTLCTAMCGTCERSLKVSSLTQFKEGRGPWVGKLGLHQPR